MGFLDTLKAGVNILEDATSELLVEKYQNETTEHLVDLLLNVEWQQENILDAQAVGKVLKSRG
ncbi:MAG: hypothetical protein PUE27_10670 [Sharpea porci]|uniref:hypothetical protein n=1 Tax=Sharpea porci TaxID=2652286 RepID=UPI00240A130C|nr:hypothetical protein [Sharpea porci]MDD6712526.1 hypothetical protein [Sharpea porci]